MKKLIFLAIPFIGFSQTAVVNNLVVTTPSRDVIWIIDNPSGRMIYEAWTCEKCDKTYNGITPKIYLVPENRFHKLYKKNKK